MINNLTPDIKPEIPATDIEGVAQEIAKHKERPETSRLTSHELLRMSLRSYTGNHSGTQAPTPAQRVEESVLPAYAQNAPLPTKEEVENLLSIAFQRGVLAATAEAQKTNPFILDAFHDALAGKLYPELKKRGLLD